MHTPTPSSLAAMSAAYRYTRAPGRLAALLTVLALLAAHSVALSSSKGLARTATSPATGTALSAGAVKAWGWNDRGQLGTGNPSFSHTPLPVQGLTDAVAIAAGDRYALALRRDGTVWAWGQDEEGQLGRVLTTCPYPPSSAVPPSTPCATVPARVPGLDHVVAIAASPLTAFALRADGTVWGWGDEGLLARYTAVADPACGAGQGAFLCVARPQRIPGLAHVVAIAASPADDTTDAGALALEADGTVWAWGVIAEDDLIPRTFAPPSDRANPNAPRRVLGLHDIAKIAIAGETGFALRRDRTLWAWGRDDDAQRGDGRRVPLPQKAGDTAPPPSRVAIHGRVVAVSAGYDASFAITADGALWSWGSGWNPSISQGERDTPMRVAVPVPVAAADASSSDPWMALGRDGSVWTGGDNGWGQLGIGKSGGAATTPQRVRELGATIAIAAGGAFALAIESHPSGKATATPSP